MIYRNSEGYIDMTAGLAIENVTRAEKAATRTKKKKHKPKEDRNLGAYLPNKQQEVNNETN